MTDILTEQNFICNDNALVINDLQRLVLQFLMEEGGGGKRRLQTLIQKLLQKLCWANYFSLRLRHSPQQPKNPKPTPPPAPLLIITNYYLTPVFLPPPPPLPWTWILLVKDTPLEHPFLALGYKYCTDIVNIVRSWRKCMSASPDNRFSDILFVR